MLLGVCTVTAAVRSSVLRHGMAGRQLDYALTGLTAQRPWGEEVVEALF
jgi:hypothetical protein